MRLARLGVRFALATAIFIVLTIRLHLAGHLPIAPNAIPIGPERYGLQVAGAIWWLLLAVVVGSASVLTDAAVHKWRRKTVQHSASFAVHTISIVAFALAALAMSSFVFELPVSALFATSSIVAVVLGFALQNTLSDLFSGIALNIEQPFHIGEWISVGDNQSGMIIEMNWRATRLQLRSGDLVIYPNSMLSRARILNYDAPIHKHRVSVDIKLDNDESPAHAIEVLRAAALSVKAVLRDPKPSVQINSFGDWSITYRMHFWIAEYATEPTDLTSVYQAIWTHLSWAGISRPVPHSVTSLERPRQTDERDELARLLARMPVFAPLAESERLQLADALEPQYVPSGSRLISQGDLGRSLFIVREGLFSILVAQNGTEKAVAELHPGDYFGEASLLTGEPRNASVQASTDSAVYELDKDAVAMLLAQRGEVAEELARALAAREAHREKAHANNGNGAARSQLSEAASRIRSFLLG